MNKIIIRGLLGAVFALSLISLSPSTAQAAITWNNFSNDCPNVVMVANDTTQANASANCWGYSVGANAGEVVSVRVDYHNTGTTDAPNTILHINNPTGTTGTTFSFTGFVSSGADQKYSASPAVVTLTSAQGLTYLDAYSYKDKSLAGTYLPNGADIMSGTGLNIGLIKSALECQNRGVPTDCHRGAVTVRFRVSSTVVNTPVCIINSFGTTNGATSVAYGGTATLSWSTSNCDYVQISGNTINTTADATGTLILGAQYQTTTFTLTGRKNTGTATPPTRTFTLTVGAQQVACTISTFAPDLASVGQGGYTTLRWTTSSGCTNFTLSGGSFNNTPVSGSSIGTGSLSATANYTLRAANAGGSSVDTKTTAVLVLAATPNCSITSFNPVPASVTAGSASTLTWTTTNCTNVTLTGNGYNNTPVSGTAITSGAINATTQFTLKATGSNGMTDVAFATVSTTATTTTCVINSFAPALTSVAAGSATTLTWSTTGCTNIALSGGMFNNSPVSGTSIGTGILSSTTYYHLTATGTNTVSWDATVTVASSLPTCTITFDAAPRSINAGGTSTLYWSTTGCTTTPILSGGMYSATPVSGTSISTGILNTATQFTLSASGLANTDTKVMVISVTGATTTPTCIINSFIPSVTTLASGNTTNLYWSTTGCTSTTLSGGVFGNGTPFSLTTNSAVTGALTTTTSYRLTAVGSNTASLDATIIVSGAPATQTCTIGGLSAGNPNIAAGTGTTLYWSTSGCTNLTLSGGMFNNSPVSGTSIGTGILNTTTQYSLTGTGSNTVTQYATVTVTQATQTVCSVSISASQNTVTTGGFTSITWSSSGCTSVNVSGSGINSTNLSGSQSVGPITGSSAYTINGYGTNNAAQSVTISAQQTSSYYACSDGVDNDSDGYADFPNDIGCSSMYDTDEYNTINNQNTTAPYVTTNAATNLNNNAATLNGYISGNTSNNNYYSTYYFQYGTSQSALSSQTTTQSMTGSGNSVSTYVSNLSPNTTYYFRLVGYNNYGTSYGSTLSFVTNNQGIFSSDIRAITSLATSISGYSARLNGLVMGAQSQGTMQVYFEYGTSTSLGLQTSALAVIPTTVNNYFDTINTSPNTTYYYRIVAVTGGQTYFGSTTSFTTTAATVGGGDYEPTTTTTTTTNNNYIRTTGGSGSGSPLVMLTINDNVENVNRGDVLTYLVNYQNVSSSDLSNAVLTVILPTGVTFRQSSQGVYTNNNSVVISLGTIPTRQQGVVSITAVVDQSVAQTNTFMATATMMFTTTSKTQDSAVAYDIDTVGGNNLFGAAAFFGFGGWGNWLWWIIFLLILIVLVLIARYYYHRGNEMQRSSSTTTRSYSNGPNQGHTTTHTESHSDEHLPH